ncbi:MAG: ATP-binding protein [Planctomycetes bacterium]|nr:ATP-binding protein [Planctomycetota bacterium]
MTTQAATEGTEGTAGQGPVTLNFTANMRYVRAVRHFISALCALAHYEEDETESIALVTTEILNNSIEHGSNNPQDEIGVTLEVTPQLFRCVVVDAGRGGDKFARDALVRAQKMPDLEEPRGRGLFLIRTYMDDVDVTWSTEGGTCIRVSKARQP